MNKNSPHDPWQDFDTYLVAYSGGKDSTALLLWALENLPPTQVIPIHYRTGADWPETQPYLDYIHQTLGVPIVRIQAGDRVGPMKRKNPSRYTHCRTLFDMIHVDRQWPTPPRHLCRWWLKVTPARHYSRELRLQGRKPITLIGQRRGESANRAKLQPVSWHIAQWSWTWRPILDYSTDQVWSAIRNAGLDPHPAYNHVPRLSCWCCPMMPPKHMATFCRLHPDIAQTGANLEAELQVTYRPKASITDILAHPQSKLSLQNPSF